MTDQGRNKQSINNELPTEHSLVCNDELFMKDLRAIVDDTMSVEKQETKN